MTLYVGALHPLVKILPDLVVAVLWKSRYNVLHLSFDLTRKHCLRRLHSIKTTFENCMNNRMIQFNIFVAVNTAKIITRATEIISPFEKISLPSMASLK